jgi:hypothetical protein
MRRFGLRKQSGSAHLKPPVSAPLEQGQAVRKRPGNNPPEIPNDFLCVYKDRVVCLAGLSHDRVLLRTPRRKAPGACGQWRRQWFSGACAYPLANPSPCGTIGAIIPSLVSGYSPPLTGANPSHAHRNFRWRHARCDECVKPAHVVRQQHDSFAVGGRTS